MKIDQDIDSYVIADDTDMDMTTLKTGIEEDELDIIRIFPNMEYSPFRVTISINKSTTTSIERNGTEPLLGTEIVVP